MTASTERAVAADPALLRDAVALVVGGYGGIGSAVSADLAAHGAAVAVAGRDGDRARALAAELENAGGGARAVGVGQDVCDRVSVETSLEAVESALGPVDLVVNCASTLRIHPAEQFPEEAFRDVVEANLVGPFLLSQAVARRWIDAGTTGRIVHLSSVRGSVGAPGGFSAYGAAKAGLDLLVRQLATEWGPYGITVNAVAPGFVPTGFVPGANADETLVARMKQRIPLRRFAEPDDIAGAVRYLLSPAGAFVNGQIVYIDGGVTASQ